ncbi:MAG TPA: ABC transporter permease subunit [Candidatus Polarisedimenticolia bacterium]|nr:ABC transporter permease subunit [Candidatus Polarisedimenticolia bacterium]
MATWEERRRKIIYFLLFVGVVTLAAFFYEMGTVRLVPEAIGTDFLHLAGYAAASFLRMLAAYALSLFFAVACGTLATAGPSQERFILPFLDIMQSVPVLGFFPAAVFFFVGMFHGSRVGVELAAIFLIFTCQAWNMAFGVYEGITTIPADAREVVTSFGCGPWKTFRRLLLPSAVPKLVYNSILSWANGWYFLIACEIIALGPARYRLPGLGSYLIRTTEEGDLGGTFMGLAVLTGIVLAMDLLLWGPLSAWAGKFRYEFAAEAAQTETRLPLVFVGGAAVARWMRRMIRPSLLAAGRKARAGTRWARSRSAALARRLLGRRSVTVTRRSLIGLAILLGVALTARALLALAHGLALPWPEEARSIPLYLLYSFLRLSVAYVLSVAWTLPMALWVGDSPRVSRVVTPLAEIGASLPATALFPLIIVFVIRTAGGMNLASVLLALTGMQWYLLFNLIAGVRAIPAELREAARSLGLSRWMTWRRVDLPAVLPSLITGSLTAWGGGWNSLIVSEYVIYKEKVYSVPGIGSILDNATYVSGDKKMVLLTLIALVGTIVLLNRLVWHRLYVLAADRYKIDA